MHTTGLDLHGDKCQTCGKTKGTRLDRSDDVCGSTQSLCVHYLGTYPDCEPCIEMCLVSLDLSPYHST